MKHSENKPAKPMHLKRKLMSALSMLLVATILLTTTSYAWFVLSTAPEVTGITTNIGTNGSLEIALLNTETHTDMESIRSGVPGNSLAADDVTANYAWGNLIDLGFGNYGLDTILLMPARLNAIATAEGYTVDSGMLAIPTYGYDGRVMDLTDNTMSAIYQGTEFALTAGKQDYGVRAIGTADDLSAQSSALTLAKNNITSYTNSAKSGVRSLMAESADSLMGIVMTHFVGNDTYSDTELNTLKGMLEDMKANVTYIDLALRQGIVAYAASQIADEALFNTVKDKVTSAASLSEAVSGLGEDTVVPEAYAEWITTFNNLENSVDSAINACNALSGGSYTWAQIRSILNYLMNMDSIYLGEKLFSNMSADEIASLMGSSITMTLAPGSGVFADIADFIGNVNTVVSTMGTDITVTTASTQNPAYLEALSAMVAGLNSASGDSAATMLSLTTTYGYALDLGFRCNANNADLLLQTTPEQRVYESSEAASTQGGGSYMEFSSSDETLPIDKRLLLMDAIRVGFLDNQNNLLGIGKLNTSNRSIENGLIRAPLYLYDFSFETDACGNYLIMGERRATNTQITTLTQNIGKALTVLVWLDGDLVDNTMVSATSAASLSGVLNLQFSTSADLVPAENDALFNYTSDKSGLQTLLQEKTETFNAGQGTFTNVSWNAFSTAYTTAMSLSEVKDPSQTQVRNAMLALMKSADALEVVSQQPVRDQIEQLRNTMGSTDDTAYYLIKDKDGNVMTAGTEEYTQEEFDSWDHVGSISSVNNAQNLVDEGNGIYTPKYSSESWNAMAEALYNAELVVADKNATDDELNDVLTNLEEAQKALEREVFFKPYEYKGAIYYEAICDADKADTYGKWYDSEFNRIISDITILNLDAYAVPADITVIDQTTYVSHEETHIKPSISIQDEVYAELSGDSFKGVKWDSPDNTLFEEGLSQRHIEPLNSLYNEIINDTTLFYWKDVQVQQETTGPDGKPVVETVTTQELAVQHTPHLPADHIVLTHVKTAAHILEKEQNPAKFPGEARATAAEVQQLMVYLESSYEDLQSQYNAKYDDINGTITRPGMTGSTRTLLTKAIGNAEALIEALTAADQKAKEEYENALAGTPSVPDPSEAVPSESTPDESTPVAVNEPAENTPAVQEPDYRMDDEDIKTLQEKLAAAKEKLNNGDTEENAAKALAELNDALEVSGGKPATEYNTFTTKLPGTAFSDNIVYDTEYPELTLNLKGQTGSSTLGAQVLTQNGVVVTVKKDVVVYNKADGMEILDAADANAQIAPNALSKAEGISFDLTSRLFYNEYKATLDADGVTVKPGQSIPEGEVLENIDLTTITWASSSTQLATVTKNTDGSCTVTLASSRIDPEKPENDFIVSGRTVYITLSAKTVQGNTYYCDIPVTIQ